MVKYFLSRMVLAKTAPPGKYQRKFKILIPLVPVTLPTLLFGAQKLQK
jgi:hypothetical protein